VQVLFRDYDSKKNIFEKIILGEKNGWNPFLVKLQQKKTEKTITSEPVPEMND